MESDTPLTFPDLPQSFKKRFPFRLSVPSFIYPANYIDNARMLAPFVDEIELLLFESHESHLPHASEIDQLASLAVDQEISYNVHLPIDLYLASVDNHSRQEAVDRLTTAIDRVRPLSPTTYTLHLPYNEADTHPKTVDKWARRNRECLDEILAASKAHPGQISIETLEYPPFWFETVVAALGLAVCIDIGHIMRFGYNLEEVWRIFANRTTMIHLHGVYQGQDHLALAQMPAEARALIKRCLGSYSGALSLEVFSFERLNTSLPCLAQMFPPDSTATSQGKRGDWPIL